MPTVTTTTPVAGIRRPDFFNFIRSKLFAGVLSIKQVAGIEAIFNEWERRRLQDLRWLAYMLATAYHETGRTMQAVREGGRGAGHDYGKQLKMGDGPGERVAYSLPKQIFYGRGLVQLTWYENYKAMGKLLGIDLLNNPDQALDLKVAVQILFEGMLRAESGFGDFTGKSLEQYFNATTEDWIGARHIINGKDCDKLIAGYAKTLYEALKVATAEKK